MRTGRDISIIAIGILLATMLLFGCPQWLHSDAWHVAFLHHFFHVNIFHLAVNSLSLWMMWRRAPSIDWHLVFTAFILASLSWFASSADVAGASNFIFAALGLRTPELTSRWWRQASVITFLAVTILMAALPQVSAVTHIVSFVSGCICAAVFRTLKQIGDDVRRAAYH